MEQIKVFALSCDFYFDVPGELSKRESRGRLLVFTDCDRHQHICQSCKSSDKRPRLGHISACIHPTHTPALQELHCVLSWHSFKHSKDVFRSFVFPCLPNVSGNPAGDAGLHSSSREDPERMKNT